MTAFHHYMARPIVLLLILPIFCLGAEQDKYSGGTPLPVGSAMVADFKGEITLHSPKGEVLTPSKGLVLPAESSIATSKGSILLDLQDGSQVLVKAHSHMVLKSPENSLGLYLELLLGKLIAKVQKRFGEAIPFRMGTPSAVITVRGTRFEVEVTKKKRTFVEVFEGVVEVQGLRDGGRAALVRPGFSTGIDPDRDPEQPRNRMEDMRGREDSFDQQGRGIDGSEREGQGATGREREGPDGEAASGQREKQGRHD